MEFIINSARFGLPKELDKFKKRYRKFNYDIKIKKFKHKIVLTGEYASTEYATVEINTLEELMELKKITTDLIIEDNVIIKNKPEILIYDDYIE